MRRPLLLPWHPVARWQAAGLVLLSGLLASAHRGTGLLAAALHGALLAFHEGGHVLLGFGGATLGLLGGTLMQLGLPLAAAARFALRRRAPSCAAALAFTGFSLLDVGRYAADARARALPLLTGDPATHDWWQLLGAWGLLERAAWVGGAIQAAGAALLVGAPAWVAWRWWADPGERPRGAGWPPGPGPARDGR